MHQANVRMPQMGSSVHESTVVEWKKSVGDRVQKGDPLLSAESDKVEFEIESPANGVVKEILVVPDTTVPVGEILAILETEEEISEEAQEAPQPSGPPKATVWVAPVAPIRREKPGPAATAAPPPPSPLFRRTVPDTAVGSLLSPRVQRLAAQHGIDLGVLSRIQGSGAGGRLTARDLERFISEGVEGEPPSVSLLFSPITQDPEETLESREPFNRLRRRIAENLTRSVREIPQVTTFLEIDMSRVAAWRDANKDEFRKTHENTLTFTPFFALAIIAALRDPENARLNGACEDGTLIIKRYVNLGVAVDIPGGLMVPVLAGADGLGFVDLALRLSDLSERVRSGTLEPDEVRGGTITLTNFGASGAIFGNPIINPPEVAIVGAGAVAPRAVALPGGGVGVRPTMGLSITFDHRANDGMAAGRFAASIRAALEGMDLSQLEY
ncbi:MAG: dihydrolipoamide acetyltransferase family protein [Nitrospinota bacterium]|nr:dihydrolipoamide acetyltransferase family protein [Nitrospinota bacterium]MDP7369949.1 dihydrolipoamide acetyltransferase family protein [Nitrospinota bacterium]MDP7503699.1 dihydrolipoamide acetyltransferase family protein [Nitrospinota bacterium]MDP7664625.1 dihydrolipoamide acetyltransferase family protein [Nitrospinota bacterium]HJP14540.1 dihydrolipoamide acetyltransferase family protein [Nitrospinota bacterium]